MNRCKWLVVVVLGVVGAAAARAESIDVVGSGGAYASFPSPIGSFGTPYWNGKSWDYADGKGSVGHYLTGTGDFTGPLLGSPEISAADLEQFLKAGGADPEIKFTTVAINVTAHLYVTIAGNAKTNVFGWYDAGGLHPLFSGSSSAIFTPSFGWFGLYLQTKDHGTFYSQSSKNVDDEGDPAGTTDQHFAVFKQTSNGKLWIGVEDLPFTNTDADFNDVILSLEAVEAVTPEPASIAMFCLGGLVLGGYRLTRRARGR